MANILFDIDRELPIDVFVANNYEKVLTYHMNPDYHNYSIPAMEQEVADGKIYYKQLILVAFYWDKENVSVKDIMAVKDKVLQEYEKKLDTNSDNPQIWASWENLTRLLKTLTKQYSLSTIDFSSTIKPENEKYRLPLFQRVLPSEGNGIEEFFF